MSKLFVRLYIFAVAIMIASSVIASSVMSFVFRRELSGMRPPQEVLMRTREEAATYAEMLTAQSGPLEPWLAKLATQRNWDVSLLREGKLAGHWGGPAPTPEQLRSIDSRAPRMLRWVSVPIGTGQRLLVHPKPPKHGPPPLDRTLPPFLLTCLILMILLIPFVQRIVRPFRNLLASIRRVSVGHYEAQLELPPRSEFAELAGEFNHMTSQIQKTLAEKQRLIADVSHELRSPLARLRVSLELMEKKGSVPEKYYNKAVAEVEQLDTLIDDLLDSSRLELRASFAPQTTEMRQYLRGILDKNQLLFAAHPIEVRFSAPEQPIWCDIDRELLERTFNNLISNTLKHAKPPACIELSLSAGAGAVDIRFRDTGPGVSDADLVKIFEPFYRPDDSRTRNTGGVGLGLSIVRKIVDLHRGEVWAAQPDDGQSGLLIGIRLPSLLAGPVPGTAQLGQQTGHLN